jgi:hypothetical protein
VEFDPDAIDRLTPDQRIEVQDYYLLRRFPAALDYTGTERRAPLRRLKRKRDWPHVWTVNDVERLYLARWK